MPKTVLAFGEMLWDLLPTGAKLGGAPFNFAYRVNCLGDRGVMASRLGRDDLGRQAMEKIRALGMDTGYIQWDDSHATGTVKVSFDEANNPDYLIVPGVAYDYMETTDELLAMAAGADCLCFGTLAQRNGKSRRCAERLLEAATGAVKLLDINLRKKCFSKETVTASLARADVLKLNGEEAAALAEMLSLPAGSRGAIGRSLTEKFSLACCLVTMGSGGAIGVSADGDECYVPGYDVALVDSLGCGDAFAAGFVHKHLAGEPLAECIRYGNAMGAIVAGQEGATVPVSRQDVEQFLADEPARIIEPGMKDPRSE